MKVIALTGGIASGKSTVSKMFEKLNCKVIDADKIVHQIYESDSEFKAKVLARFASLDRKKIATIVFQNKQELEWLEAQLHPAVRKKVSEEIEKARQKNYPLLLVEAALMVESNYYQQFDGLLLVKSRPSLQKQRSILRDGLAEQEVEKRLQAQLDDAAKEKFATWVIDNSGSLEDTEKKVEKLFLEITSP